MGSVCNETGNLLSDAVQFHSDVEETHSSMLEVCAHESYHGWICPWLLVSKTHTLHWLPDVSIAAVCQS